ncbi:hypothetical protein [Antarctobacter sp.]|uniref:hypothetical protein n=1 Tax=Antarctobacter sp. TaxID=1872577 RepID=UPI003A93592F
MQLALQINSVFRGAGWQVVKPLEPIETAALAEDLAQFVKRGIVVEFGYHANDAAGEYRIYAVHEQDWDHPLAAISLRSADMALDVLRQMPGLLGRLGPL